MKFRLWYILFFLPFGVFGQCMPGNFPAPFMWLKSDLTTVYGAPGAISGWGDSSPNGRAMNTSGVNAPTYVANGLNYNPLVRFDGVNDFFNRPGGILPISPITRDFYVYMVVKTNSTATDQFLYCETTSGANSPRIAGIIPAANGLLYSDFGDNINGRIWTNWFGIGNTSDYFLWSFNTSTTASGTPSGANKAIFRNGFLVGSGVSQQTMVGSFQTFYLGSLNGSTGFFNGDVAEFLIYDKMPSTLQQRQIQSYLAVKYGIALDQSLPQDYISTNGIQIWEVGTAGAYKNDVAVIGRDDISCLNQKQSKSQNPAEILSIGLGTIASSNLANPNSFLGTYTFLGWGNDGGVLTEQSSDLPVSLPYLSRIGREWKVQEIGSVGNTQVNFDLTGLTLSTIPANKLGILIDLDGDGNFTTGVVNSITGGSFNGNVLSFSNVDFANGNVFTLASLPFTVDLPGGVAGAYLWLKADAGISGTTSVSGWIDQSGNTRNLTGSGTSAPLFQSISSNFNPTVRFDGTNDFMTRAVGILGTSNQPHMNAFVVARTFSTTSGQSFLFEWAGGGGSPRLGAHIPWSDGNIYFDNGDAIVGRASAVWGGNFSDYFLWSMNSSTTTSTPSGSRKAVYRNNLLLSANNTNTFTTGNNSPFFLGSDNGSGQFYNGEIAEVILMNSTLSGLDQLKINSYLAVKYGLMIDQTTPTNFTSSNGTTHIWAQSKNGVYNNNIAAIGRDDVSGLLQKQSKSNYNTDILTIGLGTIASSNFNNPFTFSNDLSFLAWGNNNGALLEQTTELPTGSPYIKRISREWKVDRKKTFSNMQLDFNVSGLGLSTVASDFTLLIDLDNDGDFTTGSVVGISATSLLSNVLTFSNVNLLDGNVFTIASKNRGPGGIGGANLRLWLKADVGVYADIAGTVPATQGSVVRFITDQSTFNNNAIRSGIIDASYNVTNFQINYSPTIYFYNSTSTSFNIDLSSITNSNYTLMGVTSRSAANNENYILGIQGATFNQSLHFGYRTPNLLTLDHYGPALDASVTWYNAPYSPSIITGEFNTTSGMNLSEQRGGVLVNGTNTLTSPLVLGGGQGVLGKGYGANGFLGDMTEMIVYNRTLTAFEQQKVSSYLAIKNGITISQTVPTDYISSSGTKVWDASAVGVYKFDIAAIGRDDASILNQKQSIAYNTGDLVSIGLGTVAGSNALNTNTFTSDLSFTSWSNDHGALSEIATELPLNSFITKRIGREWKVQETGTVGAVQVNLDLTSYTVSGISVSDFKLIVDSDNDGDFTTGTIIYYPASSYVNKIVSFSNVNFLNGNVFTFSTQQNTPGGISAFLWLDANRGITGTNTVVGWADQSGNGKDLVSGVGSNPLLSASSINFNPSVYFDGVSDYLTKSSGILGTALYPEFNTYIVSRTATTTTTQTLFIEVTNNTGGTPKFSIQLPTNAGRVEYDAGNGQSAGGGRVFANFGVNTNNFYLWSMNTSATTTAPSGFQKAIYTNGSLIGSSGNIFTMRGNNSPFFLGSINTSTPTFNGFISEIIMVNNTVSGFDQKKIESYLAIKYGLSIDQTLATNYVSSNGSIIWDASFAGTYKSNIAGIGRDDNSGLLQKQSQGQNDAVALGLGTIASSNFSNTNSITSNLSFFTWSSNGSSLSESSANIPTGYQVIGRLSRSWKVQSVIPWSSLQIGLQTSLITCSGKNLGDFSLLIDQDGDGNYSTGTISVFPAASISNGMVYFNNISLSSGQVFTFGTRKNSPGGVPNTLLWLNGTFGVTGGASITSWTDASGNNNPAIGSPGSYPGSNNSDINFNPSVTFNGTSQNLTITGGILKTSTVTDMYTYMVTKSTDFSIHRIFFLEFLKTGGNNRYLTHNPLNDGSFVYDTGDWTTNGRVSTPWGATTSEFYLWSLQSSTTTSTPSGNNKAIFRNGNLIQSNANNSYMIGNNNDFYLGNGGGTGNWYSGNVSEIISINVNQPIKDQKRVESYLGLKYGISLSQSTPNSYLASDGTTLMWNSTTSGIYNQKIAGIGRDDISLLNQKQSKNQFDFVTIGLSTIVGSNALNNSSITSNLSFMTWANDNGTLLEQTTEMPTTSGCLRRLGREWKVNETGIIGNCQLRLDISTLTVSGTTTSDFNLLIDQDGDGDFTTGIVGIINATTLAGSIATFDNVNFANGNVFTFTTVSVSSISIGGTISSPSLLQCVGANSGTLTLSGFNGSILNWESSINNFTTTQTISNTAFTNAFSNLTTNTSFRARIRNGLCPSTLSGVITLTTVGLSVGGSVTGANTSYCSGLNGGTVTLSGSNGSILNWQSSPNNFSTIATISNTAFTQVFNNLTTTTSYRAVVQNSICPVSVSGFFTVSIDGLSIGGSVLGSNLAQCTGANSGTLTLSGFTGAIQNWQSSTDNFSTFSNISSVTAFLPFTNITTTTSFRAVVLNGACSSVTSSSFTVTVNGISIGGSIDGINAAVCSGANSGTLTLSGFTGSIQNWQSSTNNFATFTTVSSVTAFLPFTNLSTSTSFRAIVQNGVCSTVSSSTFTITVNGISIGGSVSGTNLSQCAGANSGTLTLSGFTGAIQNWHSSTNNFTTFTTVSSVTAFFPFTNLTTTTSFRAVVQNGVCSTVSSSAFTITVNGISIGGTVLGTNLAQCTGANSGTLTLSGFTGNIQNWQSSTDNFSTFNNISSVTAFLPFTNLTTTTSFRTVVQNGACSSVTSSSFTVTINGISIGGSLAGINTAVCSGSNSGTLTLSGFNGVIQNWQTSTNNFTTFTTVSSVTAFLPFTNLTTTTSFRAVVQNGVCSTVSSSSFTVTVNGISIGGSVSGTNLAQCSGSNSGTLTLSGFSGSIQNWQSSIDNFATFTTVSSVTAFLPFTNLSTTTSFRAVVQNGVCSSVTSSSFTVTVTGISIGGSISGINTAVCSGANSGTLTLSGFTGVIQNWQTSTNNFATFSTVSSVTAFLPFTNLATTTSFRAIVQNGVCSTVASSSFTVTVNGISIGGSVAGTNLAQCTGLNSGTLTLSGFTGAIQNWQSSADNFATFSNVSSVTSFLTFTNLTTTTSFRAIVQNGVCSSTTSSAFTITVNGISIGGSVTGTNLVQCASANSGTLTLSGFVGNIQSWQSSTNNFSSFATISSITSNISFANLTTTTSFRTIVQNGVCSTTTSSAFTITVNGISIGGSVSGANLAQCAGANSGTLTLSGFTGAIQNWQSSSDNFSTFNNISSVTAFLPFTNLSTSTSFRAIVQNGVCGSVTSTSFTVTVNGISVGGSISGINSSVCSGANSGTLTLSGFAGAVQNWQSSTNNFSTFTTISSITAFLPFINLTTTTSFRAVIQNGACSSITSSSFTVTINGISVGGSIAGINSSVCSGANSGTLTLSGFTGSIQNWQRSTDNFATFTTISSVTAFLPFTNLTTSTSFRAIVQNGVCNTVTSGAFTVTVNGISIGGNTFGPASPVCSGGNSGTITLSGYNGNIQYWESSIDNFATTQTISNSAFTNPFNNLTTTTGFRAIIQNGVCPNTNSGFVFVTVSGIASSGSVTGDNLSQCTGVNSGTLTLSGYSGSIINWESSADNFFSTQTISNSSFVQSFNNLTTSTGFRAVVQNVGCPSSASVPFTITISGTSIGGNILTSGTAYCTGTNTGILTLTGFNGSVLQWESSTDNYLTTQTISNTSFNQIFNNLTTTTSFRAIVQNGVCPSTISGLVTITVDSFSGGGNLVGPSTDLCAGGNNGTITLTGYNGNVLNWESSTDNFVTNQTIVNTTGFLNFNNLITTTSFRANIQNGNCGAAYSNPIIYNVNAVPVGGIIDGPSGNVCIGSNLGTLTLSGNIGSIVNWESSEDGFSTILSFANTSSGYSFTNLTANTSFRAVLNNLGCTSTTSGIFTLSVDGISLGGTLSTPTNSYCIGSNNGTITLSGFNGFIQNWESSEDGFSTIQSISNNSNLLIFNNLTANTSFRANVKNGSCIVTTSGLATVSVTSGSVGGIISAPALQYCENGNSGTLTLTGFSGSILNWESSTDNFSTSTFIANNTSIQIFNNLSTTTSYRVNVQNGSCATTSSAILTLTVSSISQSGNILIPSGSFCPNINNGTLTLTGFSGNILNWESSSDNFLTTQTLSNSTPNLSFSNLSTSTSFRANIQNGVCPVTASGIASVIISNASNGGVLSGSNLNQCSGSNSGTLTLSGFTGSILNWESSEDNFGTSILVVNTTPNLNFINLTTSTGYRVNVQNGVCSSAISNVFNVNISTPSSGGTILAPSGSFCSGSNAGTLTLTGNNGAVLNWESSTDNFVTSSLLANSLAQFSFVNLTTTTSFRAVVQSGNCPSTISGIQTITIAPNAIAGTISGPSGPFCSGSNSGTLVLNGSLGNIINWESSIDNFSSTSVTINLNSSSLDFQNLTQSTSYRAVVQTGTCPLVKSNAYLITISPSNAGILLAPTTPYCSTGNSGTLTLTGYSSPIKRWEYSTDKVNFTTLNVTSDVYTFSNLITPTSFRTIVQNNVCAEAVSNLVTITVTSPAVTGSLTGGSTLADGPNTGTLQLNNYSGNIIRWEESSDSLFSTFNPLVNTSNQQPYLNLTTSTYYRVALKTAGCPISYSNFTGILLSKLIIYSGFSPDGNGKNDTWVIENIHLYPNNSLKVYNRWGNLVFQETGYNNTDKVWRGNCNTGLVVGGDALPEGTYYYILSISGKPDMTGYILINK